MMPLHCVFDIPAHPIQMALGKQELLFKKLLRGDTTNHIIFAEHRPVYTYDHVTMIFVVSSVAHRTSRSLPLSFLCLVAEESPITDRDNSSAILSSR